MAKRVRKDLRGAVWIDGKSYFAGDQLPAGTIVGDHIAADDPPPRPESKPSRRSSKKDD